MKTRLPVFAAAALFCALPALGESAKYYNLVNPSAVATATDLHVTLDGTPAGLLGDPKLPNYTQAGANHWIFSGGTGVGPGESATITVGQFDTAAASANLASWYWEYAGLEFSPTQYALRFVTSDLGNGQQQLSLYNPNDYEVDYAGLFVPGMPMGSGSLAGGQTLDLTTFASGTPPPEVRVIQSSLTTNQFNSGLITYPLQPVPEPATMALVGGAFAALGLTAVRRRIRRNRIG